MFGKKLIRLEEGLYSLNTNKVDFDKETTILVHPWHQCYGKCMGSAIGLKGPSPFLTWIAVYFKRKKDKPEDDLFHENFDNNL